MWKMKQMWKMKMKLVIYMCGKMDDNKKYSKNEGVVN